MIKAVIFDMDGLMIDSESASYIAFQRALKDFGGSYSEEENSEYIGITDLDGAADIVKRKKLKISKEELVERKQEYYLQSLKKNIIVQPGLMDLLKNLKKRGIKTAIASSSQRQSIEIVIDKLKLKEYIDFYCSGREVKRGKPFPDVFLKAAAGLKADPKNCLVLEDSPKGVQAAKAAGMMVFAVPSRETKDQDFGHADLILESLTEVVDKIH